MQEQVVYMTTERRPGRTAVRVLMAFALVSLALVVQGCREEEQGRPLVYDKGTYLGQADEKLDQDQVDALRQRATRQQI